MFWCQIEKVNTIWFATYLILAWTSRAAQYLSVTYNANLTMKNVNTLFQVTKSLNSSLSHQINLPTNFWRRENPLITLQVIPSTTDLFSTPPTLSPKVQKPANFVIIDLFLDNWLLNLWDNSKVSHKSTTEEFQCKSATELQLQQKISYSASHHHESRTIEGLRRFRGFPAFHVQGWSFAFATKRIKTERNQEELLEIPFRLGELHFDLFFALLLLPVSSRVYSPADEKWKSSHRKHQ